MITNNITKNLTLNNEIKVDEVAVKGQTAIINSDDPNNIQFNDWIINNELYKSNRVQIRALEAEFEDYAFSEQDEMLLSLERGAE